MYQYLEFYPKDTNAWGNIAGAYFKYLQLPTLRQTEITNVCQKISVYINKLHDLPKDVMILLKDKISEIARIPVFLSEKGFLKEALEMFEQLLQLDQKNSQIVWCILTTYKRILTQEKPIASNLVSIYSQILKYAELVPHTEKIANDIANTLNQLGVIFYNNNLFLEAIEIFKQVLRLNPKDDYAPNTIFVKYRAYHLYLCESKSFEEAAKIYEQVKNFYFDYNTIHHDFIMNYQNVLKDNKIKLAASEKESILQQILFHAGKIDNCNDAKKVALILRSMNQELPARIFKKYAQAIKSQIQRLTQIPSSTTQSPLATTIHSLSFSPSTSSTTSHSTTSSSSSTTSPDTAIGVPKTSASSTATSSTLFSPPASSSSSSSSSNASSSPPPSGSSASASSSSSSSSSSASPSTPTTNTFY
jgi:tetratricopeptide (TPR) repeat protein